MSWRLDGRPLRRVLVTRLRYLGDVVMSTVVIEMLRRGDPDLRIDVLCEASHATVLAGQPDVARVHALGARRRGADARARAAAVATNVTPARGTVATVRALRRERYDLAVDLFFNPRSAWLLALAGIPRRIGGTESRSRGRLYTHRVARVPGAVRTLVERLTGGGGLADHLQRLAPLELDGRPATDWLAEARQGGLIGPRLARPPLDRSVTAQLEQLDAASGAFTLLAPGATWPTKEWPLEHWRTVAGELAGAGETPVVLQPPGRPEVGRALAGAIPAGRGGVLPVLALPEALAVVAAARRLVTVDGGIMHAAVGMRVPTLALFGPTAPEIWFPYEGHGPYRVLATRPACHPCDRHQCDAFICLPDLVPARVLQALQAHPFAPPAPV
ncbi:hypothetical protein GF314_11135 [bacterium]|nr:hypothetical protein [bacterium]